ncbi:MAG: hypothetical protein AB1393_02485 [Candidatus Edwardsbacteria bacterium]
MKVYHALLDCRGFFSKTDRQPSGGGVISSPYIHDFALLYAFFEALNVRSRILPSDPQYIEDIKEFFPFFPVYIFPTVITRGFQKTESINVIPSTRSIPERESKDNVPKWNFWLGYKAFMVSTTVFSDIILPSNFYIRLGKKRTPIKVSLIEVESQEKAGNFSVGLISPIMHSNLKYGRGTLIRMNPSPLFIGGVEGEIIFYRIQGMSYYKPINFKFISFTKI